MPRRASTAKRHGPQHTNRFQPTAPSEFMCRGARGTALGLRPARRGEGALALPPRDDLRRRFPCARGGLGPDVGLLLGRRVLLSAVLARKVALVQGVVLGFWRGARFCVRGRVAASAAPHGTH
eukprot:2869408-Prymnesium_polylepis.1